jgi:hypothetical protein
MKKLLRITALISVLALMPVLPALADDYQPNGVDESTGKAAFTIEDSSLGDRETSSIVDEAHVPFTMQNMPKCHDINEDTCTLDSDSNTWVSAILPICGSVAENCLEAVKIYKADEVPAPAKFLKTVAGFTFPSNPTIGNQRGSTPSVWDAPTVPNAGGSTKYVVEPRLTYSIVRGQLRITEFQAAVFPIVEKTGSQYKPVSLEKGLDGGKTYSDFVNGDNSPTRGCVATDTGWCGWKTDFSDGTRVELTLKLSNQVTGWLHGRLKNPEIKVTPLDPNLNEITIGAESVTVPKMYAEVSKSDQPDDIYSIITQASWGGARGPNARWHTLTSDNPNSRYLISKLAKTVNDTAAATSTIWQVRSLQTHDLVSQCLSDQTRLLGLVTTNAMAYEGSAPKFADGQLSYSVGGLHYLPDGKTLVEGTYDLAIRSDAARCLYGFSSAPISATVSVVGENGDSKVATTTVKENDGWLHLAAYGFTFSSPTIAVKLTQAAPAPISKPSPATNTNITCVKGKLSKKVSGTAPKCPAGYKKK